MNYKSASLMFALVGALALAGAGCSHSSDDQAAQLPATPATAPMPQTTSNMASPAPAPMGTAGMQPAPMGSTAMAPSSSDFDQLAGGKGYLARQDVAANAWLEGHFDQCDADHDGKLTRDEFNRCTQGQNTMGTGPSPSPAMASSSP